MNCIPAHKQTQGSLHPSMLARCAWQAWVLTSSAALCSVLYANAQGARTVVHCSSNTSRSRAFCSLLTNFFFILSTTRDVRQNFLVFLNTTFVNMLCHQFGINKFKLKQIKYHHLFKHADCANNICSGRTAPTRISRVVWFYCTRYANKLLTLDLGNVFNVRLQLLMHLMALYLWSH